MESLEKQLISTFPDSWNESVPSLIGRPSALKLLALREVPRDSMTAALAVANTWSSAFAAPCSGGLSGVLICLFKGEEGAELDRLIKGPSDGAPKPGARALVGAAIGKAAKSLSSAMPVSFGAPIYIDLTSDDSRLASIVGETAWVGTFSLSVGEELNTQMMLLYGPHGSLAPDFASTSAINSSSAQASVPSSSAPSTQAGTSSPQVSAAHPSSTPPRNEAMTRNIERLLNVELDVVVRFGITNVQLREVVRMGVGTMVELNRAVDEPVELLVNGRLLARGEVVVVDGYYGVRITEIGGPAERALSLL